MKLIPVAIALLGGLITSPAFADQTNQDPERQRSSEVATGEESVAADVMIRGTVMDADDAAVSGADVLVFPSPPFPEGKQFKMEPIAQAVTGPDGSFQVIVRQGSFAVTARSKGMLAIAAFGGSTGDHKVIDGMDVHMKPIARATGRVLDPDGQPIAGQLVRFNRSYGYSIHSATKYEEIIHQARGRFSVVTDEQGRFEITSPADTAYTVTISSPFAAYQESHTVTDGAEILLQLDTGDVATGRVLLANSLPAEGAHVEFRAFQHSRRTTTDASGRFEIRGIRRYDNSYITVRHQDAAVFCLQPVPEDTSNLELKLEQGQIIEGRVVDAEGHGIEGARIKAVGTRVVDPLATHVGIKKYTWEYANHRDQTTSGRDGRFRFTNLYPGTFELTAALQELHIGAVTTTTKTGSGQVTIELSPATTRRAAFEVLVLGQASGEPVPQTKVRISPAGGAWLRDLVTDDAGSAKAQGFEPGSYFVETDHADFAIGREPVNLRLGDNDVRIELSQPVDVELRVREKDGQLIQNSNVKIGLKRANGEMFVFPVSNFKFDQKLLKDGVVKLKRVPSEMVTLVVDLGNGEEVEQPLDLRVESGSVINVVLDPPMQPIMFIIIATVAIVIFMSGWMVMKQRKS